MEPLTAIGDGVRWVVEKVAMPALLFFFGYKQASRNRARDEVNKERERYEGEERRQDEFSVQMQQEFSRRWQHIEDYWTQQNDELRKTIAHDRECHVKEIGECRSEIAKSRAREDDCERREDALQLRLGKFRRWGVQMVTVWNLQFPENPMELPPENGL